MLGQFSFPAGAAHADVFQCPCKTGHDVAFKVGNAYQDICLDENGGDFGHPDKSLIDFYLGDAASFFLIGDNRFNSESTLIKTVLPGELDMIPGIQSFSAVERIGVG